MTTRTGKSVFLWICTLLLLCTAIATLSFSPEEKAVVREGSASLQTAGASTDKYQAVTEIEDGSTIVFSAYIGTEGAKDGTQFVNQQDRLLKTALYPNTTETDAMTETVIQKNDGYIDFNDTNGFSFMVENAGVTDAGNQGYYLRSLTGIAQNYYLSLNQSVVDLQPEASAYTIGGKKAGLARISQPYVCLSQDKTHVWYWDTTEHSFYTFFTSDPNSLGVIKTTDDRCVFYFVNDDQGNNYLVDWQYFNAYADMSAFPNTSYSFNLQGGNPTMGANKKLTLIGSNPTTVKSTNRDSIVALSLNNPYYNYTRTSGTATPKACLGVYYDYWMDYVFENVEKADLTVYQKLKTSSLTVEGGTGSGNYVYGQTVTITADGPDDSGHFSYWRIFSGNAQIASINNTTTTIALYADTVTIKAERTAHNVTAQSDCTQNTVCSTCGYVVEHGNSAHNFASEYIQYEKDVVENGISVKRSYHTRQCVNSCYGGTTCTATEEESACSGGTATCTQRAVCSTCGNEYGELAPHTPEVVAGTSPSCTETGLTDGSKCSVCGVTLEEQQVIPALGHDYTDVDPEWSWDGLTAATASFKCTRENCGHVESCDAVLTDEITTPATCTLEGVRTYTATVRFDENEFTETRTETVEKAAHTPEVVEGKAATCTETGLTDGSKCSVCGLILEERHEIAALGHTDADGDFLCDRCGLDMSVPKYSVKVEGGTLDGADGSTVMIEENVSVTAIAGKAPEGKTFKGWSTDGGKTIASTDEVYTFVASADVTLTAVYEDIEDVADIADVSPEGLSGGAIAGIVIGSLCGALLIAYGICALLFKKRILKGEFFAKIYPFIK